MPRYRVSIGECVSYDLIVEAETPDAAGDRALELFGRAEDPAAYLARVAGREVENVEATKEPLSPAAESVLLTCAKLGPDVDLDDLVHDQKSAEAANLNNEGQEAQVRYLLRCGVGLDEIMEAANG